MPMLIGLSLTPQPPAGGEAPPPAPASGTIALYAFSRDRTLFDGGAAFGRAEARVPLGGTGTPGRGVEARAVAEGGAPATQWAPVATVGADGSWSGAFTAPRASGWMRPEVRLAEEPWIAAQGARRFGVGHVIAIWGQSEVEQMLQPNHDEAGRVPLIDEDAVQVVWHDRDVLGSGAAGVRHLHLTDANPLTGAVSAMADTLLRERPGEKFCIVFQAKSGTHFTDLLNDAAADKRRWEDDEAAHRFATADGQHVGLAAASWFAAPSNLGRGYGDALFPAFFGVDANGASVAIPGTHSYRAGTTQTIRFDHGFGDLYDYAHTKWVPYGPHRFEPEGDLRDATTWSDGRRYTKLENIESCRRAWREMAANPRHGGAMLPITVESLNYLNGEDGNGPGTPGGWDDITHPADDTLDGLGQFGRLTAHAVLRSAGLTSWPVPEFDRCLWDPAGAWVELWSTAGPVTTTRRARGLAPVGTDLPHWTEVVGFEIDGAPATRAEITPEGRVRVHPRDGAFTSASVLTYGSGGATGALNRQADLTAGLWMNLPIVAVGAAGIDGVAVRPLPDATLLASTVGSGSGSGSGGTGTGGGETGGSGTGGSGGETGTGSGGTGSGGSGTGGTGTGSGTGGGSTGGSAPAVFFTRDAGDAHFVEAAGIGAGVSGITVEMVVRLREQTVSGMQELFEITSTSLKLDVDMRPGKGQLRVIVEDSTGAKLINGAYSATGVVPAGRWVTIRLSSMQNRGDGTGFARVAVDGAQAFPPADNPGLGSFATTTGQFAASRSIEVLDGAIGLDVARISIWKSARPDGAAPAAAPYKVIEGGAAAVNADPWKVGTTSFT